MPHKAAPAQQADSAGDDLWDAGRQLVAVGQAQRREAFERADASELRGGAVDDLLGRQVALQRRDAREDGQVVARRVRPHQAHAAQLAHLQAQGNGGYKLASQDSIDPAWSVAFTARLYAGSP